MEVNATPVYENVDSDIKDLSDKKTSVKTDEPSLKDAFLHPIEINRTRKNNLFGDYNSDRPDLRDYN